MSDRFDVDPHEDGVVEGSAVEIATGRKLHFTGHYLTVGKTGHFAVSIADSSGERKGGASGTLPLNGTDARTGVLEAVMRMIAESAWQSRADDDNIF
jgi:hypothetical protein